MFNRHFLVTIILLTVSVSLSRRVAGGQPSHVPDTDGRVKIAAVQLLGYDKTDLPRPGLDPTKAVVQYIARAAADGAQLVVFPEYVLGHIRVPGLETKTIAAAAAAGKIYVIIGCWEDYPDQTFANTALLFDRTGEIAGKYHKVHAAVDQWEGKPPWSEPPAGKDQQWFLTHDPEWKMKRGDRFPVFDLDFGKVGILTCYDGWFPESFRVLSLEGAEVLVWINGRQGAVEDFIIRSAVFRNEVAMVATNQAYGAGTTIAQWPSQILARVSSAKEAYLTATIDLKKIRRIRQFSRNAAQRRPELYRVITESKEEAVGAR